MPEAAFKDMWATIGRGKPWTGVVKNRRKNGDHYWVVANVTPIMESGKPTGYMSVRTKPTPAQVEQAQALYAAMARDAAEGSPPLPAWRAARLRLSGLRGQKIQQFWSSGVPRLEPGQGRAVVLIAMLPHLLGLSSAGNAWVQFGALLFGSVLELVWFERRINANITGRRASLRPNWPRATSPRTCTTISYDPLGRPARTPAPDPDHLARRGRRRAPRDRRLHRPPRPALPRAANDLSARTESQASNLEQTSATMNQLASTLGETAESARQVARHSAHSTEVAQSTAAQPSTKSAAPWPRSRSFRRRRWARSWA